MDEPEVTRRSLLCMQLCVPSEYTNIQVLDFAEKENPCGTTNGWFIRLHGDKSLNGCDERVPCEKRVVFVHIMLDA